MKLLRKILFPIVPIYYVVTWMRNWFYDLGVFKSKSYNLPVICVGNLSTGGTGKSPMIELLIRVLKDSYQVATLSRGYKRETQGFRLADNSDTAKTLGDEPFQFFSKFYNDVQIAVDSNRQRGIENLISLPKKPDVILLDDAFQHRKVAAGFNILLTTYHDLYADDWVLPTGNLREPKQGAKRAQLIVVTKCPNDISDSEKEQIILKLKPEANQNVFFSSIDYSEVVFSEDTSRDLLSLENFTLVTGIANASPLVLHLKNNGLQFEHLNFPDHHAFTDADISRLGQQKLLLTTEKDFMRLKGFENLREKLFYLPIKAVVHEHEVFKQHVLNYVKSGN
ncbi:tetraacyldisaccharide 4'-kinase [Bizionia algoritergicola]|uniref:Tetraacyldisaccharide 4'-kinase n=2 Tax=Bizionia algoritergicola TaxID=291187 RepID=A0A5D0QWY8_9FLAO|nr:tetraacyldisaccharide 4'-kinase [Bizionia sp. APA-3]OBX22721.1 tetraacyldisaccharide 4'-kinase [Bizionia sp. APA-3]TYB72998.1 tetraacyldisaccharide 4'-kinase [Bizionia algoritergicola]